VVLVTISEVKGACSDDCASGGVGIIIGEGMDGDRSDNCGESGV
jgi:hypothetical protein